MSFNASSSTQYYSHFYFKIDSRAWLKAMSSLADNFLAKLSGYDVDWVDTFWGIGAEAGGINFGV